MGSKTHGMFGTPEYKAWAAMKQRCDNPTDNRYHSHGGRGIIYDKDWIIFEHFYRDMGDRPSDKHSLDRIDNDGNYSYENCRWATQSQQSLNKRVASNNTSGYKGVYKKGKKWEAWVFLNKKRIYVGKYSDLDTAIVERKKAEKQYYEKH